MLSQRAGVAEAYDRFAAVYDEFNKQNNHEVWVGQVLLPELEGHGLKTGRVLDIGCGTGKAFDALLSRGWSVEGCDASPNMLLQAQKKLAARGQPAADFGGISLEEADARALPRYRAPFDLILLLNDVVNYLTEDGDLERCFEGVARNLATNGLVCFDANTIGLFRSAFLIGGGMRRGKYSWRGLTEEVHEGGHFRAEVSGPDLEPQIHNQRHWTRSQIESAATTWGLRVITELGQSEEGLDQRPILREPLDLERDYKAIYIVGRGV